jgi:hypothetical protein
MDDAHFASGFVGGAVRVLEGVKELKTDLDDMTSRQCLARCAELVDEVSERPPPDEFHDEERLAIDFTDLMDVDDVLVPQALKQSRLGQEHADEVRLVEMLGEHPLDDTGRIIGAQSEEQLTHPAGGEAFDQSMASEGGEVGVGHVGPGLGG